MICRHGCFKKLVIDTDSRNTKAIEGLIQKYEMKKVVVLAYHPQANSMIEKGHESIVNALSKMTDEGSTNWNQTLLAVL